MKTILLSFVTLLTVTLPSLAQAPKTLDIQALAPKLDSIARYGIDSGCYPGCQVLIAQRGEILYSKSFGHHTYGGRREVRSTDLYDLASITKAAAVALGIMKMYDEGRLDITDKASKYLTWLQGSDKEDITIEELLYHTSGITGWIEFYHKPIDPSSVTAPLTQNFRDGGHPGQVGENTFMSRFKFRKGAVSKRRDATHNLHVFHNMWLEDRYLDALKQDIARRPLGEKNYAYSDVGFDLLVWVVEAITGENLNDWLKENFYGPMGVDRTLFLPAEVYDRSEIVPTISRDWLRGGKEIRGYCEDDMVAFMGGIGGGAGLFSTAGDLFRIFQMLLNLGELDGQRYLSEETCRLFLTRTSPLSPRLMGFGKATADDPNNRRPLSAFGHGGVTGTDAWVDPENGIIYVYLTNRLSPVRWNDRYMDNGIQRMLQDAIYDCLK